jgi:hypothetical protein
VMRPAVPLGLARALGLGLAGAMAPVQGLGLRVASGPVPRPGVRGRRVGRSPYRRLLVR